VDWQYIVIVLLAATCVALAAWALRLRGTQAVAGLREDAPLPSPPTVSITVPPPTVTLPPAPAPELPLPASGRRARRLLSLEPDIPAARLGSLGDPQALPDAPDSLPDSTLDGARLGRMVVRAVAVRGEIGRLDAVVRRQATWVGALNKFDPPVLLSSVAAGLPDSSHSQLGAVQACRSLQGRLADRATATAVDAAWKEAESGTPGAEEELRKLLRGVLASVSGSLTRVAKERALAPEAVTTEFTFLLSQLGDTSRRRHLVAGVGGGVVLRLSPDGTWTTEYSEADDGDGQSRAALPDQADLVSWRTLNTGPGDLLVLCSATTASFLARDQVRADVTAGWRGGPPDLIRFLWYLSQRDQIRREDRAAVGIWEIDGRSDG
jgi:hypothetical protein